MTDYDESDLTYDPEVNICTNCRRLLKYDFEYCPYCGKKGKWVKSCEETTAFLFHDEQEENP